MNIELEEIKYQSSNGNDTVFASIWYDKDSSPKGVLQITHGMSEYIARYDDFARFMVSNGFAVCGNDHIGHGRSVSGDDKLGYFAKNGGDKFLVEDVHLLFKIVHERFSGIPYFLLGHSMGSFITREFIVQHGSEIDGYICSGTGGRNPLGKIAVKIAGLEIKRLGEFGRSKFTDKLAFGSFNKRFEGRTGFDWLSRDTAMVDKYISDKLCGFLFTTSGFRDLTLLQRDVSDPAWAGTVPVKLPILFVSGALDPVGNYGAGVQQVAQELSDAGMSDITVKLYPECRHEVLNETNRKDVYCDILDWITERL